MGGTVGMYALGLGQLLCERTIRDYKKNELTYTVQVVGKSQCLIMSWSKPKSDERLGC